MAGCAQPGPKVATKKQPTQSQAAVTPAPQPGKSVSAAEAISPGKAAPAGPAWDSADTLMGLESAAIRAALGAPARIRNEDTARIYQYIGGDCVLDLFLYQAEGVYRVTYAEARTVQAEHKAVEACLKTLPAPIVAANVQPST